VGKAMLFLWIAFSLSLKEILPTSASNLLFFLPKEPVFLEPKLPIVQENTLRNISPLLVIEASKNLNIVSTAGPEEETGSKEIKEYIVKEGETLNSIASQFNISVETILWANNLQKNAKIIAGQKLTILPVSGVLHLVEKGETISQLAEKYQASVSEIISFNELSEKGEIFEGDLLIIPYGKMSSKSYLADASKASKVFLEESGHPNGYFICPISPPCFITQGLHYYNAVDFSNGACGEPVFASAMGKVQRIGYHSIAGNYIVLLHPTGVSTFYGHLSKISVKPEEEVSQGQIIGFVGNTGYTVGKTGCHLHFEVRGAKNPFAY
jgi:murein DD-endopeptidase MepM/ murein hydrolase activator NlpD